MPTIFQNAIRTAINDKTLQAALDLNARRRIEGRATAMATLEDPQAARRMAHAVRADTIEHLERYLDQFTRRAESNGLTVHKAAGPEEANAIILDIVRRAGARTVAKAKSMVSEEIGLNHALESAGIQAVETDLGEYIVQLRRERPSHIITPAVHLTRQQVSDTFQRQIGTPPTDDIKTMTAAARKELRRVFLSAGVGISGVNFGVAESGALCIVTNEGNGRMVTSLPPVHIAVMGIERLVPTWADLALMLALLPRSATGQKITVYTNIIKSPRRADEPDGPLERHLVLLDHGRTALRDSPLAEALLCIRCGACLNACPIFREIGGHAYLGRSGAETPYPGPIGSIIAPGLFGQAEFGHLARASTLCGACKEACPVDIDLPKLLLRTRVGGRAGETPRGTAPRRFGLALQVYSWLATDTRRFHSAQRAAAWLAAIFSPRSKWIRLPAFTGWGVSRRLPRPGKSFSARYTDSPDRSRSAGPSSPTRSEGKAPQQETFGNSEMQAAGRAGPEEDPALVIERFKGELEALGGVFKACSPGDLPAEIAALLHKRGVPELISWSPEQLPEGLLDALEESGIKASISWKDEFESRSSDRATAGLTGALAGVAATGTLVLTAGPGRSLSASLLPDIHLAVLRAGDIRQNLSQALALKEVRLSSSTVLISGPSRTADIEMTLTVGVHGPREVYVFCLI